MTRCEGRPVGDSLVDLSLGMIIGFVHFSSEVFLLLQGIYVRDTSDFLAFS